MHKLWKWYLPGYIMAAPLTLFGILLALVWYRPAAKDCRFKDGCIEMIPSREHLIGGSWVGGQTFGNVIFFKDGRSRDRGDLNVHERCHTVQAMILGILFALIYGVHFLILWASPKRDWQAAYYEIVWEKQAYRIVGEYETGLRPKAWGSR